MLQVEHIEWSNPPEVSDTGYTLYKRNPKLTLTLLAPIYWWVDCGLEYLFFEPVKNKFCFDMWEDNIALVELISRVLQMGGGERKMLQVLPMGTYARAEVPVSYTTLVKLCEDYTMDEYYKDFYKREWRDLCETLMDIRGVRDLVKE